MHQGKKKSKFTFVLLLPIFQTNLITDYLNVQSTWSLI